jgi:hypothetical protein
VDRGDGGFVPLTQACIVELVAAFVGERPHTSCAVVQQAHGLEVGAAPGQLVLDLRTWATAVEDSLLFLGEPFQRDNPVVDLPDRA